MKKKIVNFIIAFTIILSSIFASYNFIKLNATSSETNITITYNIGDFSNKNNVTEANQTITDHSPYDKEMKAVLLNDYNDLYVNAWGKGQVVSNEITYEAAFAGWMLTSINGQPYTLDTYFYPDHDNVYFNDEPFISYIETNGEITSLGFSAMWAKTVYIRDKYDFVDLTNIYSDPLKAVINWDKYMDDGETLDTSKVKAWSLSENPAAGSSKELPLSSFDEAMSLVGETGGKIHIVNHYTVEEPFEQSPSSPSFTNSSDSNKRSVPIKIGNNIKTNKNNNSVSSFSKTNGVITISGELLGNQGSSEKTNDTVGVANNKYENSFMYLKNTRGCGLYNKSLYQTTAFYFLITCDVVFEHCSIVGYRESYASNASRYTADAVIHTPNDTRFVTMDSFRFYKRSTSESRKGVETSNWSFTVVGNKSALSIGGYGWIHLYAGYISKTGNKNIYVSLFGKKDNLNSFYSIFIKNGSITLNNIHMWMDKIYVGNYYGIKYTTASTQQVSCNTYDIYMNAVTAGGVMTSQNTFYFKANELNVKLDGPDGSTSLGQIDELFLGCNKNDHSKVGILNRINDVNLYIVGNAKVKNLYGGGNQIATKNIYDNLTYNIESGTITSLYGGSSGGPLIVNNDITMNITGGTISYVFGGGEGGLIDSYESNSPFNASAATYQMYNNYDFFTYNKSTVYNIGKYYEVSDYEITWAANVDYPQEKAQYDIMYYVYLFPNKELDNLSNWYRRQRTICISEAKVTADNIIINIGGDVVINNSVYGGGKNGAVSANIQINIDGGTIKSDIFGGGQGKTTVFYSSSYFSNATIVFRVSNNPNGFTGTKFNELIENEYSTSLSEQNISYTRYKTLLAGTVYENKVSKLMNEEDFTYFNLLSGEVDSSGRKIVDVYSDTIDMLGLIEGNININISSGDVRGKIYGGSDGGVASITGDTNVSLGNKTFKNNDVYGGGNEAIVYGDTLVNVSSSKLNNVFGGGNQAEVTGSSTVNISNADTIKNIYGGGNLAEVDENSTVIIEGSSNITNVYGGGNEANINGDSTLTISSSNNISNIFGGGNAADIKGESIISIDSSTNLGNVFGGGNLGDTSGNVTLTVSDNSSISYLYGGANEANIGGNINTTVSDSTIKQDIYGGNNLNGNINGNITTTLNTVTVNNNIYGGGNEASNDSIITLNANNCKAITLYGGGKKADVGSIILTVDGGTYTTIFGGGDQGITNGDISNTIGNIDSLGTFYGGANKANVNGNISTIISNISLTEDIFGGNNLAGLISGNVTTTLDNVSAVNVYGGGNEADNNSLIILESNNLTASSLYGGGKLAQVGAIEISLYDSNVNTLFGGGDQGITNGNIYVLIEGSRLNNVYGGANQANVNGSIDLSISSSNISEELFVANNLSGAISNNISAEITDSIITNNVYGGGNIADFDHDSSITFNNSKTTNLFGGGKNANVKNSKLIISKNSQLVGVYGGGYNGHIENEANVTINSAIISNNVYGGGYAGTTGSTSVVIKNTSNSEYINISGSVFGGGEGSTATVYDSTDVLIDMIYEFEAEEQIVVNNELTSGEIETIITSTNGENNIIKGNVYGGGDLGRVGQGTVILSNNSAENIVPGKTNVTINSGLINGSVFGGGSGIPKEESYNLYMGIVFGHTNVDVYGGYIKTNVYGGGTQSRLYYGSNMYSTNVATINIDEKSDIGYEKIAIGGSVFGGGDRGSGASTNATVPTTIGDVIVNIIGNGEDGNPSQIYFIHGGIYGDGNFCLVKGDRTINVSDFNTGEVQSLKTFYSLQRADVVNLDNSRFVLLGAIDLVEEGDTSIYSINRIGAINFTNGSTIKLDQIVKYLGEISSDLYKDRQFILKGNNGTNNFTSTNPSHPIESDEEVYLYQTNTTIAKNTISVANGLYLLIEKETGGFGAVYGLFTLQLLYAVPGEGGGFVYADIATSTGMFICETVRSDEALYKVTEITVTVSNYQYFYTFDGVTYNKATSFDENETYYQINYMSIIHDVSNYINHIPTRYCWFIDGSTIRYNISISGYIGSSDLTYSEGIKIPSHDIGLYYALRSISVNDEFASAITSDRYNLVTNSTSLTGQDIAVEVVFGSTSLGFLEYDNVNAIWKLNTSNGSISGYGSHGEFLEENFLFAEAKQISTGNDQIIFKLHKSSEVNAETIGMSMNMEISIHLKNPDNTYNEYNQGTNRLIIDTNLSIIRLVPTQSIFYSPNKYYDGVGVSQDVVITENSSFTMQYITRYIPNAFPTNGGEFRIDWAITTYSYKYYMDSFGNYFTLRDGELVNLCDDFTFIGTEEGNNPGIRYIYKDNTDQYYYYDGITDGKIFFTEAESLTDYTNTMIPKGTMITLKDETNEANKFYYYIVNEDSSYISINDFMLMGSTTTISSLSDSNKPTFMTSYIHGGTSRITENLILVFDYSKAEWGSEAEYASNIKLQHLYGKPVETGVDIMDFVKTDINVETGIASYSRFAPLSVYTEVRTNNDGLENFDATVNEHVYSHDIFDIDLTINEKTDVSNSLIVEGDYAVKIELVDGEGNYIKFPHGVYASFKDVEYYPMYEDKYIVVPVINSGNHHILVYNLHDELFDKTGSIGRFKISLYSTKDAKYLNDTLDKLDNRVITEQFEVYENPTYSLSATISDIVINSGDSFDLTVIHSVTGTEIAGQEAQLDISFKYKDENGKYADYTGSMFNITNTDNVYKVTVNEQCDSGTYIVVVKYGNKEVIYVFIVK